ncbi:MAG: glycosyltransferase family 4 protein [Bryobacteraceae bacterium]
MTGNVAFLLDSCPATWTSKEEFHARLCAALRQRGGSPVLALSGEPPDAIRRRFEASGAEVVALPYRGVTPRYFRDLRNLIGSRRISLVHIRYFDYFSALPWLARLAGARRIVFTDANGGEWRAHGWRAALLRCRTKCQTRPIDRIIAISTFVGRRLVSAGVDPAKIVTVYNGVDLQRFRPDPSVRVSLRQRFGIRPDEIVISTIGVLRPLKHPEIPVRSLALLTGRGLPVRLLVAGDGPMRSELQALAADLGIAGHILWLGHSPEPWTVLQVSDLFTLATAGEAFGFVVAEAMACGVAVVCARSGGLPEVVDDGATGLLATPLSPDDFANKLQALIENAELRDRCAKSSLERATALFGVDTAVSRTLEVYDRLA